MIPGSGRFSEGGNSNLLQYSCLENSMDGGVWWGTVYGVTKSQARLSDFTFFFLLLALGSALERLLGPTIELVIAGCHIKLTLHCMSQSDQEIVHCCCIE